MEQLPLKLKILSALETKADLMVLEDNLNTLSDVYGKVSSNHEQVIKQLLDFVTYNNLSDDFQTLKLNINNQADFESFLDFIEKQIKKLKILKLTTAISPTKETVDEINYWIDKTLGESVLVELNTDKSIIGGLIIEYDGKYKDYSLRSKLEQFFKNNPQLK